MDHLCGTAVAAGGLNQSEDPAEIAKYLKGAKVDTVMGPLSWDEKGDLKGFEFGVFTAC